MAVGSEGLEQQVNGLLAEVGGNGGAVKIVRGAYGQGKTFSLNLAEELAVQNGFWVAHTEVDATERRLDKPSNVYRGLMQNLRIPGARVRGVGELATKISTVTRLKVGVDFDHYQWKISNTRNLVGKGIRMPPFGLAAQ